MAEGSWYVVHTYSGYENKVKANIEKTIENRNLQDQIFEVLVPVEEVVENRNEGKKTVTRKMFPGYVFVNMLLNDDTWYVVRNTRGVTGFVGPGSKPVPLTPEEMAGMGFAGSKKPVVVMDIAEGDYIEVIHGIWEGVAGKVRSVNQTKQAVTINVDMFGRETPVEISYTDIKKA